MVQPSRRRQVEPCGIAADLHQNRGKAAHPGSLLGNPQRIGEPAGRRDEEQIGIDGVKGVQTRRIGQTGLGKDIRRSRPQDRHPGFLQEHADQRHDETGRDAGIAGLGGLYLREGRQRQSASERCVEAFRPGGEKIGIRNDAAVAAQQRSFVHAGSGRREAIGQAAPCSGPGFDPGNVPAQGSKSFLRRGG